ncbi:MAG: tetratricopeptide repeat protein [Myxococcota bacterium]|nr:tetratricopeptide repeat protein [Myxococcota bacterium]
MNTNSGANPDSYTAIILFADLVDSSILSHILSPIEYNNIVKHFQKSATEIVNETLNNAIISNCHLNVDVRGDELCLILALKNPDDKKLEELVTTFLQIAIRLKRKWLLVESNEERINKGQSPLDLAIGIHSGPVIVTSDRRFKPNSLTLEDVDTAEGYAINLAKRVETASRMGRFSRIFITQPIYNRTTADFRQAFDRVDVPELKGIPVVPFIYEAKGVGHFDDRHFAQISEFTDSEVEIYEEVVSANPGAVWLLLDLAHMYFDKGNYEEAAEKYQNVLNVDPDFAPAHAYKGRAYFRDYWPKEAKAALVRAIEIAPGQARINHYLGVCLRREAVIALWENGDYREAKKLFEQAIYYHERAHRIKELQNMELPWALNGLLWTIAQSFDCDGVSTPFDLDRAYEKALKQKERLESNDNLKFKLHLILHTAGFICLQQAKRLKRENKMRQHRQKAKEALDYLNMAKRELEQRDNNPELKPDSKGLAERKAEIIYHIGCCQVELGEDAQGSWQGAILTIVEPWPPNDVNRVLDCQYWLKDERLFPAFSSYKSENLTAFR